MKKLKNKLLKILKLSLKKINNMPLTKKGKKIMTAMKKEYGATKGKGIFYASANKGTIKGVEKKRK